jgi:hypothetical protein
MKDQAKKKQAKINWVPVSVRVRFAVAKCDAASWPQEVYGLRNVDDLRCWRANERLAMTLSIETLERKGFWSPAVADYAIKLNAMAMKQAREMPSLIKTPASSSR